MAVYKTPTAERAFIDIYIKSVRKFGMKVAQETALQLEEVEKKLRYNPYFGKTDPDYHSDHFRYVQIKNRHKIFYETDGNDVFIVMADYDGRDFKALLQEMTHQIAMDIAWLRKKLQAKTD